MFNLFSHVYVINVEIRSRFWNIFLKFCVTGATILTCFTRHFYFFPALNITFSILPEVEAFIADPNLLAFRCQTLMPSEYEQNFFDVAWYIEKTEITLKQNIQHSKLDTDGVLYQTDWNAHKNGPKTLGFWVSHEMNISNHSKYLNNSLLEHKFSYCLV